jgi:hypothetical protein
MMKTSAPSDAGLAPAARRRSSGLTIGLLTLAIIGLLVLIALLPLASILGFFGQRTYLVLFQNSTELRPYGGFIGVYGEVVLKYGRVVASEYGDPLELDGVYDERLERGEIDEFEPHQLYAPGESPDFPTTALFAREIYAQLLDTEVDGAIAVDPAAVGKLIQLVGPLRVEGEREPVTEANLLPIILKHTQDFDQDERKQFVFDLAQVLLTRLRALPISRWPEVWSALAAAADERHIQIDLGGSLLQRYVRSRGWDGAMPPPTNDFLAVVDSNVGYNKANLVTDQALDYRVTLAADGTATATLKVDYHNKGTSGLGFSTKDMPYVDRATYEVQLLVLVPEGSERLTPGNGDEPWKDLDRTWFEEYVTVPPESRASTTISYRLPRRPVEANQLRYELFVRKQAGTAGVPLRVQVIGPEGWRVKGLTGRLWSQETVLTVDRAFTVELERR